jgi:tetratricopeptide (TPR) repeat protein
MSEQERLDKLALSDLLMKEGINGRSDDDAIARASSLTTLALDLGRADYLTCALAWYETLESRAITGTRAVVLDLNRANAIAGSRYGTTWHWDQPTLAREIFYLRRALSNPEFSLAPDVTKCKCLNNLGSRLLVSGRAIEALECWRRALEIQPHFGMALCNRARVLANYAAALDDPNESVLFMWMAHNEASAALAPTALYTDVGDRRTQESTKMLKEWIESEIDVAGMAARNPLTYQDTSPTENERDYRQWCLANGLFVNPLNDLGAHAVAASDPIGLAEHVVPLDAPHRFESFYDQMKQEYVSARWLLYEGLTAKLAHFSDRDVLLRATEPAPSLSLAIESIKAAYRISYSLFDKVGFFVAHYMELGIPERKITFRTLWREGDNKPIRKEFDSASNWGFCALYWLAKDFFEKESDEVAEPQARGLSDIRNHIEHKYLRVTVVEPLSTPADDLALMVSREQFQAKTMHLLKLARSALIYLAIGVRFEERRREPGRMSVPVEDLPPTPRLPDSEKQ